jgi:hypothetical protein
LVKDHYSLDSTMAGSMNALVNWLLAKKV